jgi:alpha-beta hydrolase superfamily lysophospholipase
MQKIEFSWSTSKNIPIFASEWKPDRPANGVIVLVHGIGEHIGRYEHVAKMFADNQYAFISSDLIGHGKSGGQRGHADSFDDFYDQITWMLQEAVIRYPALPVFLYGHSLGANLVLRYIEQMMPPVAGAIVTSPALEVTRVPPVKLAIGKLMYRLYPRFSMTNSLDTTGLSHDENVVNAYLNDPLVHPRVSARLGLDLIGSSKLINDQRAAIKIPLLILHGELDRLVKVTSTREFVGQMDGRVKYFEIPGGFHELHNEPDKQEIFNIWLKWLDDRVKAGRS